jgi:hypothetical protein
MTVEECTALVKSLTSATDWTKYVVAVTALVAVIVGPLLQWAIARRQAADNISAKRQNWIDELRKDAAEYLTLIGHLQDLRRPTPGLSRDEEIVLFNEKAAANAKAMELALRIRLRLNPSEVDHNELNRLFEVLARASPDPTPGEAPGDITRERAAFFAARENVVKQLQAILKKEWERVKSGK